MYLSEEIIATGFYIDKNTVVSVYHTLKAVPSETMNICVATPAGEVYKARIVGIDDDNDVIFLDVDAEGSPLTLLDSLVEEGSFVLSVGFAEGVLRPFITYGLVSGLEVKSNVYEKQLEGLILLNMSIAPGMSGAPIVNLDGRGVGMIISRAISSQSLSLALPSTRILLDYHMIRKVGRIIHIKLGIRLLQSSTVLRRLGLKNGLIVAEVLNKELLKMCDLNVGDVIVKVNDVEVSTLEDFRRIIAKSIISGNNIIELTVIGGLKEKKCHIDINKLQM
jgi:serine protease DegS